RNIYEYIRKSNTYTTPLPDDPDSKEYKQVLGQRLLNLYLSTSLLFVIGEKLRAVLRTKKLDIYLVSTIACTFTLTVVIFGFEFFALQRLEPASFSGVSNPPYLLPFVAFSFANSV